ncbi:MAG TPA: hydroxymethylpyrimidine/phosphomethylpyrimidine kinase [Gammaproteobacteria bacterium]|nr:hydroxymethylpyrimidine/phosphomethylpyrimidine kinase [Gammaproteobacteria bacterium]
MSRPHPPTVLIIAGNDPSGGAGLAADIQAVTALGAHPAPVVTAVTVQDTVNVHEVEVIAPQRVVAQAKAVLADQPVAAIKLGLLGNVAVGTAVAALLRDWTGIPLVVDPVLVAGGGGELAETALTRVYLDQLLPLAELVTPNALESRRLAPQASDAEGRAAILLDAGCRHVLLKGGDEPTPDVCNTLYSANGAHEVFRWPRLPGHYHGSGCTLASAIAARLAQGCTLRDAVADAQQFTWDALHAGWQPGKGQHIPLRRPRT